MATNFAQLLSSSTTGITVGGTITVPGTSLLPTLTPTIITTAYTVVTTVTKTVPVIIGEPTPTYTSLTTYTSTFTSYETYTQSNLPTPTAITGGPGEVGG
ncbi:hypothetical protein GGH91_003179, partial [Coemansia sp. RSA 2671]